MNRAVIIAAALALSACNQSTVYMNKASDAEIRAASDENICSTASHKYYVADRLVKEAKRRKLGTDRDIKAAKEGKVFIGMSACFAKASWGIPYKTNTTTTAYGTSEQWIYGYGGYYSFLYIRNGKVSAIQN